MATNSIDHVDNTCGPSETNAEYDKILGCYSLFMRTHDVQVRIHNGAPEVLCFFRDSNVGVHAESVTEHAEDVSGCVSPVTVLVALDTCTY